MVMYLRDEAMAAQMLLRTLQETQQLESEDDIELILDSETDFTEALEKVITANILDEAHILGIGLAIKDLKSRAERKKVRIERHRSAILAALEMVNLKKKELAMATVSVCASRPKVIITDEELIPDELMRVKTIRDPDLVKIADELKAGREVPGALLSNTSPMLMIRGK